jgi:hypothetical protein
MSITKIIRGKPETWVFDFDIDITGYTIVLMIKDQASDTDASARFTKQITTHSDPTNGTTSFIQTASETNTIPNDVYWFAVKAFDSNGDAVTETDPQQVQYVQNIVQALTV